MFAELTIKFPSWSIIWENPSPLKLSTLNKFLIVSIVFQAATAPTILSPLYSGTEYKIPYVPDCDLTGVMVSLP